MRASGWFLIAVGAFAIPLAIGIATGAAWAPYLTYTGWAAVLVGAIVRAIWPKRRPRVTESTIVGVGDVYNELFMAQPRQDVTFGDPAVVAEESDPVRDQIDGGKITLRLPPQH